MEPCRLGALVFQREITVALEAKIGNSKEDGIGSLARTAVLRSRPLLDGRTALGADETAPAHSIIASARPGPRRAPTLSPIAQMK